MIHLGDITKISGYDAPIVDIITGGSPCQDLSVAGKRAGLAGERSGLFMEQVRIIKEMREKEKQSGKSNDDIRPRYMVWENVPGALSSNKGEDFRAVLEETAKVCDKDAVIPGLAEGQKWTPSGCIMGDGWSIAWRIHDAQFWGVPQRRKRIALVADFGGASAPEILFERKGMQGDIGESGTKRQDPTGAVDENSEESVCYGICSFESNAMKSSNPNSGIYKADTSRTLDVRGGDPACNQGGIVVLETYDVRISTEGTKNKRAHCYPTDVSRCLDSQGENPDTNHGGVIVIENHGSDCRYRIEEKGVCQTLTSNMGTGGNNGPLVLSSSKASYHTRVSEEKANALVASDWKDPPIVYGMDRACFNQGINAKYDFKVEEEKSATLVSRGPNYVCECARDYKGVGNQYVDEDKCIIDTYQETVGTLCARDYKGVECFSQIAATRNAQDGRGGVHTQMLSNPEENFVINHKKARRMTPLECERLQGFPDGWTDIGDWIDSKGKKHKGDADAPRYKALGNSIALPFWEWMAERMCRYLNNPTMASLFDGIGGFPLAYSRCGCEPIWASEIEEFPIAVTKIRFK